MIKDIRVSYKIGFSSALSLDSFSGYNELSKWGFTGELPKVKRLKKAFLRGYQSACDISKEVKFNHKTQQQNGHNKTGSNPGS